MQRGLTSHDLTSYGLTSYNLVVGAAPVGRVRESENVAIRR